MSHLTSIQTISMKSLTVICLMLLSLASSVSYALTYKTTSIEQAVRKADLIVYVTVNQQETVTRAQPTKPDAPKRERLFTLNTVKVHQAIKGTGSNTLIIKQSGGTKAGLTSLCLHGREHG